MSKFSNLPAACRASKVNSEGLFAAAVAKSAPKSAKGLAASIGVPANDLAFRRAVTHYAQGSRVLSPFRDVLIRANDPDVYIEPRPIRAAAVAKVAAKVAAPKSRAPKVAMVTSRGVPVEPLTKFSEGDPVASVLDALTVA